MSLSNRPQYATRTIDDAIEEAGLDTETIESNIEQQYLSGGDVRLDSYAFDLLEALDTEKSVNELREDIDIPIATVYRRLNTLEELGMVVEVNEQLSEGRSREKTYQRTIRGFKLNFPNESGESFSVSVF